jgi:DNA-binding NtrC family response regulator
MHGELLGPEAETAEAAATRSLASDGTNGAARDTFHLLVVERSSSRMIALPAAGFRVIGRDPEVDVRVEDPSASRRHARLQIGGGEVRVVDLGSRNGLRVNGTRIDGACDLAIGDVITIGDVALILRGRRRSRPRRAPLGPQEIAARLQDEIDRSLEARRPLSLAVLVPGPRGEGAAAPRASEWEQERLTRAIEDHLCALDLVGRLADGNIAIVLGERGADEARAAISILVEQLAPGSPSCRAGIASCPEDGCDAATLVSAARDACEVARGPGLAGAADRTIVIADPAMARLFALIERLAAAELAVLVSGETGVGKEHAAFAVHHGSSRRTGPFVAINCAAIPDTLLEGELFGHAKGAFSGAHAAKPGLFERAAGGTLFLDEVGELSLAAQAKLLRVLEGGRFVRLGDTVERQADVRIVAATNRDLAEEVRARRFREDLFYRLGSAVVLIPPLRERPADVPVLARTFLATARERAGKSPLSIAPGAMLALSQYAWPGNVRELKNAMEFVAASIERGPVERAMLPPAIAGTEGAAPAEELTRSDVAAAATFRPLAEEIEALERQRIREALAAAGGVKTRAARLIGVPERTFRLKLRQFGLG